jgi:hypothetical protein
MIHAEILEISDVTVGSFQYKGERSIPRINKVQSPSTEIASKRKHKEK